MKLPIERFTVKEEYPGVRSGFKNWGVRFLDELISAQLVRGVLGLKIQFEDIKPVPGWLSQKTLG